MQKKGKAKRLLALSGLIKALELNEAAYSQQRWLAMPHAVEEFAPGPPSPQHGALLAAGYLGKQLGAAYSLGFFWLPVGFC